MKGFDVFVLTVVVLASSGFMVPAIVIVCAMSAAVRWIHGR